MVNTKERPIALTAQEVSAVLAGDKTQHRVPFDFEFIKDVNVPIVQKVADETNCTLSELVTGAYQDGSVYDFDCPFGEIGDRLWVQEDWRVGAWREIGSVLAIDYKASPDITNTPWVQVSDDEDGKKFEVVWIAVTDELDSKGVKTNDDGHYYWPAGQAPLDWRDASIMERWASRLLLEITDIRIERVRSIESDSAEAEGCFNFAGYERLKPRPLSAFITYWMAKHGDESWWADPWVWVIKFKVVEPSEVTK